MKVSFGFLGTGLTRRVPHFWPQLVRPVLSRVINPIQSPSHSFLLSFKSKHLKGHLGPRMSDVFPSEYQAGARNKMQK